MEKRIKGRRGSRESVVAYPLNSAAGFSPGRRGLVGGCVAHMGLRPNGLRGTLLVTACPSRRQPRSVGCGEACT